MKPGILATAKGICVTKVKQEQNADYPSPPQILNLTSIYRQPLSATKDPQVHSQNTLSVQQGGLTPHGPCYSPVAEVKNLTGRPQVCMLNAKIACIAPFFKNVFSRVSASGRCLQLRNCAEKKKYLERL